ncbi:MAG TPA: 16S rRNA (cytidine(1402)-2'-O)-methyltransferase [Myxococcota bacterium]|nr:16S rRNA (cytidine(1402)-2'-O)-methyltransferase [Myxococcota bacterium]HRY93852.1 16S rRNA (cytidine(1402)-2'-O)-methyltransferase [Myxococcota bacterium]HSA24384.1 16S rRNA (cytidine(1402)-2'-O)-methyltransferase [Myxococcota bacterium]
MDDPARPASPVGTLYLIATPIGNLEDLSARALRLLGEVELVAAEDTRHTQKLLAAHALHARLVSYREQNHIRAAAQLLEHLRSGRDAALVSDAGTPGISDPGQALVAEAIAAGVRVVPVPGPCAAVTALAGAGLPTDRFLFLGFPPRRPGELRRALEALRAEPGTLVLYESPQRLAATLAGLREALGDRPAAVARELTKLHESFVRGSLSELVELFPEPPPGEVVILVGGADPAGQEAAAGPDPDALARLVAALRAGRALSSRDVVALLEPLFPERRNAIYKLTLDREC